ncbi:MAG: hypothetical protein KDA55_15255, partial [Planctomycetales bacterium]|nr:hypothetical protein [Planctomycetales bacterium]
MRTSVDLRSMHAVLEGNHGDPAQLLGPREMELQGRRMLAVRTFLPNTTQVWFHEPAHERSLPMRRIHPAGLYEAICPVEDVAETRYHFRVAEADGSIRTVYDPYSFPSLLTDYDLHLFGEGNHAELYNRLGAQIRTIDDVAGVNFAVWAPNASAISVVGDFNGWDGRRHVMRRRGATGVWEIFLP